MFVVPDLEQTVGRVAKMEKIDASSCKTGVGNNGVIVAALANDTNPGQ